MIIYDFRRFRCRSHSPHVQRRLGRHRTGAVRSQKAACSRPTVQEVGTTMRPVRHMFTLTSLVSSLSTIQLSSLVEARQEKDRLHHHLKGISTMDTERVFTELQTVLTRKQGGGSGVDWRSITPIVMERYAERLDYLQFLLSPNAGFTDAAEQAANVRAQVLTMLVP